MSFEECEALYRELDTEAFNGPGEEDESDFRDRDFLQGRDCSQEENIGRPPVEDICDYTDVIEFMQTDCDYYSDFEQDNHWQRGVPVLRLFGVTAAGNSVCAHIHDFRAYLYISVTGENVTINDDDIEHLRNSLNHGVGG